MPYYIKRPKQPKQKTPVEIYTTRFLVGFFIGMICHIIGVILVGLVVFGAF